MPSIYVATFRNLNYSPDRARLLARQADEQIPFDDALASNAVMFTAKGEFVVRVFRDDRTPPLWRAKIPGSDGRLPIGRRDPDKAKRDVGKFFDSQVTDWKEE